MCCQMLSQDPPVPLEIWEICVKFRRNPELLREAHCDPQLGIVVRGFVSLQAG